MVRRISGIFQPRTLNRSFRTYIFSLSLPLSVLVVLVAGSAELRNFEVNKAALLLGINLYTAGRRGREGAGVGWLAGRGRQARQVGWQDMPLKPKLLRCACVAEPMLVIKALSVFTVYFIRL